MHAAKVVVIGPGEAGKSTLIQRLCDRALNLEVNGRTVAMDHGALVVGDLSLSLVGVPGQPRFGPVREVLIEGAAAAIWVHPSGTVADAPTVALLDGESGREIPYLVIVNTRAGESSESGSAFPLPPGLRTPSVVLVRDVRLSESLPEEVARALFDLFGTAGIDSALEDAGGDAGAGEGPRRLS